MKRLPSYLLPCALLAVSLTSLAALADDAPNLNGADPSNNRFWFFGGGDIGYTHLSTKALGESNLSGTHTDVKGLFSYYQQNWVVDAGFGWFFNHLTGNESTGPATINTRSPFAEAVGRYRFNEYWSAGPTLNVTFGSDMSLSPVPTSSTNVAVLGGLQIDYECNPDNPNWRFRLIARALNSIGLNNHSLLVAQGGFQIGFPITPAPEAVPPTRTAEVEPAITPTEVDPTEVKPVVQVVLGHEFVHFDTASSRLSKQSRVYLTAVGKMLAQKDDAWQVLEISGHTDHRGSHAMNMKLSKERAASVRKALIAGGASSAKIRAKGYSYDRPVDPAMNEAAYAKNRRVEMNFMKASDPDAIREGMDEVKAKFQ